VLSGVAKSAQADSGPCGGLVGGPVNVGRQKSKFAREELPLAALQATTRGRQETASPMLAYFGRSHVRSEKTALLDHG
jgi:hypothetical protein